MFEASISGLLFIPHWWGGFFIGRRLNESMLILSNLELLTALPYIAPITTFSGCQSIDYLWAPNRLLALWERDLWSFVTLKVCEGPLGYAEGSPLTLRNHFIQLYGTLDTHLSQYYYLLILLYLFIFQPKNLETWPVLYSSLGNAMKWWGSRLVLLNLLCGITMNWIFYKLNLKLNM